MKAESLFKEKRIVIHAKSGQIGIVELKIWAIPKSVKFPTGRKFSLFLVADGEVILGIDNHHPKGPHLHLGERELTYDYVNDKQTLEDFWDLVRKAGFKV